MSRPRETVAAWLAQLDAGLPVQVRVRDDNGLLGTVLELERRVVPVRMVAVLYDDDGLRRFGPILIPATKLTFLTDAAPDPTDLPLLEIPHDV